MNNSVNRLGSTTMLLAEVWGNSWNFANFLLLLDFFGIVGILELFWGGILEEFFEA